MLLALCPLQLRRVGLRVLVHARAGAEYRFTDWISVAAGPSFRGAIPIYVGDDLQIPVSALNGPNFEIVVKLAPKWLK